MLPGVSIKIEPCKSKHAVERFNGAIFYTKCGMFQIRTFSESTDFDVRTPMLLYLK